MVETHSDERAVEFYSEYQLARRNIPMLQVAPYPKPFSGGTFEPLALPFHSVAQDALREIANSINDFGRYVRALKAWNQIYQKASKEDQYVLLLEHVRPLATLCLTAPQALRGRFIYAATSTSYYANAFSNQTASRPKWTGSHTDMKTAKTVSQNWSTWPALAAALNRIGRDVFNRATSDFRNQHEHGHPRSIELGHIGVVQKIEIHGRTGWSLGQQEPMKISELLPTLEQEHGYAMDAFTAYLAMVEEQNASVPPIS
ncbi:hypothetical protein NHG95_01130 [Pseudomonas corrugata]|uniref:hypothetical protein n=1 Tax=Pseudomonas corrugata TaxID=47879 RepID=UPI0028C4BA69|nr:hypothetical protein [Pseudomonas corrugata]MDU9031737.1 hypothetical protein [Pseudomonas corrugata]MDU9037261.1 hypothetical protein [Pseudomonas corrugata]